MYNALYVASYIKDLMPYIALFMGFLSCVLALVLICTTQSFPGKNWLVANLGIELVCLTTSRAIPIIVKHMDSPMANRSIYDWYSVINVGYLLSTACFVMFLFSIWSSSRMVLNMRGLLFSFSGRIPRSAFWILVCILFPVGTMISFIPYTVHESTDIVKGILWSIYGIWTILSIWISLAIYAKRWHDCGKSGWMSLVMLIPIVGPFWLLGYCGFVRGTSGPNQYGEDTLDIALDTPDSNAQDATRNEPM